MSIERPEPAREILVNERKYFKVTDDGMIGDRIMVGDVVLIDCRESISATDIVAIADGSTVTLRRIEKIGSNYKTIPSNPDRSSEMLENILVLGKVIMSTSLL